MLRQYHLPPHRNTYLLLKVPLSLARHFYTFPAVFDFSRRMSISGLSGHSEQNDVAAGDREALADLLLADFNSWVSLVYLIVRGCHYQNQMSPRVSIGDEPSVDRKARRAGSTLSLLRVRVTASFARVRSHSRSHSCSRACSLC